MLRPRLGSAAGSCPRPTYWRTFGAGAVGWATTAAFTGAGFGVGLAVAHAEGKSWLDIGLGPEGEDFSVAPLVGAGIGFLLGVVPGLLAQRAVLRSTGCPAPRLGRLFLGNVAQALAAGALRQGAAAVHPRAGNIVGALSSFATTPISQALVKN